MTAIDVDGEDAADGLLALVVAVVELLVEAMEREGIRRMESGQLSDEQIERLGQQFQDLETEIEDIKETADIESDVDKLRSQLNGLVDDALRTVDAEAAAANVGERQSRDVETSGARDAVTDAAVPSSGGRTDDA